MAKVQRNNKQLTVPDDQVTFYASNGYRLIDEAAVKRELKLKHEKLARDRKSAPEKPAKEKAALKNE